MIKAGVIGHPIAHSKSPFIHGFWLKHYGIDGEYTAYDIEPAQLAGSVQSLVDSGLRGFNVTLPHKQNIIPLCDTISHEASAIGAVNTITISDTGKLHGHNTDAYGFTQNLNEKIADIKWPDLSATVIGAGGAARAIVYALRQKGVKDIFISNRTYQSAKDLADLYDAHVIELNDLNASFNTTKLLVNTTSLGMTGQPSLEIDLSALPSDAIVYDIVYTPLMTPLLQQAASRNLKIVTGIGMLLHQARPGFEAWFGHFPEVTRELEELILTKK